MRIFLSFASEQKEVAEAILLALRDRGYSVFFAKDDMPAGASYDARIQKAVLASDLMLFLISPESVTRGRYTLTELSFARQRWPNPSGHVLPVLVATTPLDTIPAYLRAVTILEPLGNLAAETSAEVDKFSTKSRTKAIIGAGFFGIVTALCSYFSMLLFTPEMMGTPVSQGPKFPYLQIGLARILPGLIFGLLVSACTYQFSVRERFLLLATLLFTACGWVAAVNSSAEAVYYLEPFRRIVSPSPPHGLPVKGLAGIAGGFVGGFFTLLGVSIASPAFRRFDSWGVPLATATILGGVLHFLNLSSDWAWLILFLIWQPAVSASIARELARRRS